jgi:hypothetical protein
MNNGAWTIGRERVASGATLLDESDRFYAMVEGEKHYGYQTRLGDAYVCYTCGHLCECGEEGEE